MKDIRVIAKNKK